MSKLVGKIEDKEAEEEFKDELEEVWIDPTPNLVEGIFYVPQINPFLRCCTKRDYKTKPVIYDHRALYCLD